MSEQTGGDKPAPFASKRGFSKRKGCRFCIDKVSVDYKDFYRMASFISDSGKIVPARIAGTCARHQRALTRAIKKARTLAMLPPLQGRELGF